MAPPASPSMKRMLVRPNTHFGMRTRTSIRRMRPRWKVAAAAPDSPPVVGGCIRAKSRL